jgi:hypothetical protein
MDLTLSIPESNACFIEKFEHLQLSALRQKLKDELRSREE